MKKENANLSKNKVKLGDQDLALTSGGSSFRKEYSDSFTIETEDGKKMNVEVGTIFDSISTSSTTATSYQDVKVTKGGNLFDKILSPKGG